MDKYTIIRKYFGHSTFRRGQEELIDSILSGRDCLGIMPTGGGKSLCYQVPALLLPGLTLVISPLISLMKDQVAALEKAGIPAAFLNSAMDSDEYRRICAGLRRGEYKLIYAAPERLENEGFLQMLCGLEVSLAAVDEAHCISQWGQDFRPSYLSIADSLAKLPKRQVLAAFTATATEEVRQDIIRLLRLEEPSILVTGFDRPNLFFDVQHPKDKTAALHALLRERRDRSGIVYCATRAKVEQVSAGLERAGIPAARYHAGLSDEERRQNQDDFQYDRKTVMVATNAFGMGIDKSNVSFVIHYNMPKSLEAYYQEAGRAGRDGSPADCILLFSGGDIATARFLIEHGSGNDALTPEEQDAVRQSDMQRLQAMADYCRTGQCLRGALLRYFGQEAPESCGSCGNCCGRFVVQDITIPAQKILSCVKRIAGKLGYSVGKALLIRTLRGGRDQRLLSLGLDSLTTYGIMREDSPGTIRSYLEFLEEQGYLETDPQYGAVRLTPKASEVLFRGKKVEMPVREDRRREQPAEKAPSGDASALFSVLKALRTKIAQQEGVPAYIVFTNAALQDMAARAPRSMEEFLAVSGVGEVKAARYGSAFLSAIGEYLEKEGQ